MSHQGFDKNAKIRNPRTLAALHILKGSLAKHLQIFVTVGSKFESKDKARIIVEYDGPTPDNELLSSLEKTANLIIKENRAIETFVLNRKEAEEKYKNNLVNGQFIYEKRAPPESVEEVTIIHIPDWTICCSVTDDVCPVTSEVGSIKVLRFNHRPQKKELELCFQISGAKVEESTKSKQTVVREVKVRPDDVNIVADSLFDLFITQLESIDQKLDDKKKADLKAGFTFKAKNILTVLKNASYASGMSATNL